MYPKLKIESGKLSISGECIKELPYEFGIQWEGKKEKTLWNGTNYKFKMNVNGDKGELIISDKILQGMEKQNFQELLLSEVNFGTNLTDFSIIIKDVYKFWLEMPS